MPLNGGSLKPEHLALSRKLKDPKRLAKLLEALVRETLGYMGITI